MAKVVQRKKLSWLERLYIPALWNGFKVTLGHFFSWKKSEVYGEANKDNKFKTTLNYPEELWTVPKGFRGAPYLVSDQDPTQRMLPEGYPSLILTKTKLYLGRRSAFRKF